MDSMAVNSRPPRPLISIPSLSHPSTKNQNRTWSIIGAYFVASMQVFTEFNNNDTNIIKHMTRHMTNSSYAQLSPSVVMLAYSSPERSTDDLSVLLNSRERRSCRASPSWEYRHRPSMMS